VIGSKRCNKPIIKSAGISYECLSCGTFTCFSHRIEHQEQCVEALKKIEEERKNYKEFNTKLGEMLCNKYKIRAEKFHSSILNALKKLEELKTKTKEKLSFALEKKLKYETIDFSIADSRTLETITDRVEMLEEQVEELKEIYDCSVRNYNIARTEKEKILSDIRHAIEIFTNTTDTSETHEQHLQILKTKIKSVETYQTKIIDDKYRSMSSAKKDYDSAILELEKWKKNIERLKSVLDNQKKKTLQDIDENLRLIKQCEQIIEELEKYAPCIEFFHVEYQHMDTLTDAQADKLMNEYCKKIPSAIRDLIDIRF
jgi:archaellum component FlaC